MIINDVQFNCALEDVLTELVSQLRANNIPLISKQRNGGDHIQITCPYHSNGMERKPSAGIRKSDGAIVIPSLASEFTNGYYRNNTYYKYYELLSDIQKNSNEYEEVVVLNTIYNEKSNQFFIELIDKDTFDIYTSSSREARLYSRELKLF